MFRAHRAHHQERQIVSIQPLVAVSGRVVCRSEVQPPEVVLTQFVSPDDEHDVLETCTELKNKEIHRKGLCVTLVVCQEFIP